MKKVLNFIAVIAVALCIVSCGDDNEEGGKAPFAGDYAGTIVMSVGESIMDPIDGIVTLTVDSDDKVTIVLPEAKMNPKMSIPSITLKNVQYVKAADGSYNLKLDAFNIDVNGTNYVSKGLNGTVRGNVLTLNYDFQPGAMPMSINIEFMGNK